MLYYLSKQYNILHHHHLTARERVGLMTNVLYSTVITRLGATQSNRQRLYLFTILFASYLVSCIWSKRIAKHKTVSVVTRYTNLSSKRTYFEISMRTIWIWRQRNLINLIVFLLHTSKMNFISQIIRQKLTVTPTFHYL